MFCYQCEETVKGTGCTVKGVCGKEDEIAAYQDLLIYICKGISKRNLAAMEKGEGDPKVGLFIADSLFSTLTNVNFDKARFSDLITSAINMRDNLPVTGNSEPDACTWKPKSETDILEKARTVGILATSNEDVRSLRSTLLFGLKGIAAYYTHASILGKTDESITTFLQRGLASTLQDLTVPEMVALLMECGSTGVTTLSLLDEANTSAYGNPRITNVKTTVGTLPGILITGHDLKDMEQLLEQSKDAGVEVYTHGEMLPAHAYPAFKKYTHLYGNYGGSWPHQKKEFERFNGPVLVTTNCIVPPADSYRDRLFTTGLTGYPGVKHIFASAGGKKDFSSIIDLAKTSQPPQDLGQGGADLITGCAHDAVLAIADKVVNAVSYNIAWYEQKALLVLLSLLSLGIKNITLGPKLPAFVSPAVLDVLVKNFDLKPNTTVDADLARMLKGL